MIDSLFCSFVFCNVALCAPFLPFERLLAHSCTAGMQPVTSSGYCSSALLTLLSRQLKLAGEAVALSNFATQRKGDQHVDHNNIKEMVKVPGPLGHIGLIARTRYWRRVLQAVSSPAL